MRQGAGQYAHDPVELTVAVVKIVNDAYVGDPVCLECLDDGKLVLRLPKPVAVVVEANVAADFSGSSADGLETGEFSRDAGFLVGFVLHRDWSAATADPELWLYAVSLEKFQRGSCLVVEITGEPPTK